MVPLSEGVGGGNIVPLSEGAGGGVNFPKKVYMFFLFSTLPVAPVARNEGQAELRSLEASPIRERSMKRQARMVPHLRNRPSSAA